MKKTFTFALILLVSVVSVFAGGGKEEKLYYLPRNVIGSQSVMIELTTAKSPTNLSTTFENNSTDNLALFRMRSTLNTSYCSNVCFEIVPADLTVGFNFVKDDNQTIKVPFGLKAYRTSSSRSGSDTYTVDSTPPQEISGSNFEYSSTDPSYSLPIETTTFSWGGSLSDWDSSAEHIYEYDVCMVIPNTNTSLPSGHYTARLKIRLAANSSYKEKEENSNSRTDGSFEETIIEIHGYVGAAPGGDNIPSFAVLSSTDTYSMNLAENRTFNVAIVNFAYNEQKEYDDKNNKIPTETVQRNRFRIYISPVNSHESNASGEYRFIKIGTESATRTDYNTIWYNLYLDGTLISTTGEYNSASSPYLINPNYNSTEIQSRTERTGFLSYTTYTTYILDWSMNSTLTLKVTDKSLIKDNNPVPHQSGLYQTNVYFFLVYN